ncbi:MAG: DUF4159 domain-containing protein [Rhodospirillales bacterium]|nr:DUF4159 domain-containing protein [Rhodospirillales bacterium]MSP79769.1 DUF4159 domain-containing protein [Rhodospirillales bacterium]
MITLGPFAFAAPWALLGLLALPALWFLLRLMPPAPREVVFPPVRILMALARRDETSATTPPWLIALRFTLAAAAILGLAHPILNAEPGLKGSGPLVLVLDDGWAAAKGWSERTAAALRLADRAGREGRAVMVFGTAARTETPAPAPLSAAAARRTIESMRPKPWPADRGAIGRALLAWAEETRSPPAPVAWLSDGLEAAEGEAREFVDKIGRVGAVMLAEPPRENLPLLLRPPRTEGDALALTADRAQAGARREVSVIAYGDDGRPLAREQLVFPSGRAHGEARMALPLELRNRLARLEIENETGANAVALADERWRRRPVGLAAVGTIQENQPLLGDLYYLERALEPWAEARRAPIAELLARALAVLVLADPGPFPATDAAVLARWIETGGVAVRFAGPRLATATQNVSGENPDPFLPVRLRAGDRVVGGALTWERPVPLAAFDDKSPFFGLPVSADVRVRRQVLAEPALDLAERTWARLADGTPLVTAERRGRGWLVLIHVTANAQWSDLPLSGLFVGMLQRLVALSQGVAGHLAGPPLAPEATLDGFGRLGHPPADAQAITAEAFAGTRVGPRHPPGFYGERGGVRALNLADSVPLLKAFPRPVNVETIAYGSGIETDLRPWLLGLAFVLLLADLVASLALRGLLFPRPSAAFALALALAFVPPALAQERRSGTVARNPEAVALAASADPTLAYILTGNRETDATSRAGLEGLGAILRRRTAAEMGPPIGVDPEQDELSFFPLIYWPIEGGQLPLGAGAQARLNTFMRQGGTILFDSRGGEGESIAALRALARQLDLPALEPVGPDHVLTRTFYLLQEFPGRYPGGRLWAERAGERVNDGVSSVIVGGGDWAAAWAVDDAHRPLFPVVPGGERQREYAYRFGVNVVMYVLTGNYKSDQVHVPAIMQRLRR